MKRLIPILLIGILSMGAQVQISGKSTWMRDYTDYCADANCLGCWRFEEDLHDLALDTASTNHGTESNATYDSSNCQEGNCWEFNGTTSKIDAGSATAIDNFFDGGGSIVAWINADAGGENDAGRILDKRSDGDGC